MRTIVSIFAFICCFATSSNAQVYLNDTSLYNSLWCSYKSVYEVDTGYFVMGNIVRAGNGNTTSLILGFHNNNGSKELILDNYEPLHDQRIFGSIHKLFLNNNDNFVYLYNNCESGVGCYPRLKEITTNGTILNDISYLPIMDSFNYVVLDGNNIYQKQYDSSYIVTINVTDTSLISQSMHGGGILYFHLDENFALIDTIPFFKPLNTRDYVIAEVEEIDSGNIVLMIPESLQSGTDSLEEANVLFIRLDSQNNILDSTSYTDGQKRTI